MIEIDEEIYNEVLNELVLPKMPLVKYRKNHQLAMAEETIELLLQKMIQLGLQLKSGQKKL